MMTGDCRLTAMAIAADVGVDDVLADATPVRKLTFVRDRQSAGERIAMCGDGTNDAPALAQADLAIVMNTGTTVAKDAGDMIDLDSNPAKFIQIVETGRQMRKARRLLATFSISTDLTKYFLILGAAVATSCPHFHALNVMRLASPFSAILSAGVFGALFVMIQIPLALVGVKSLPLGAVMLPRRNLLIYGLGGMLTCFVGIKVIDMGLVLTHLA
jgi:K+-transporting ATPase ATPase B chain